MWFPKEGYKNMKIKGIVACLTLLMGGVCAVNAESEPQSQYALLTDEVLPELSATGSHRVGVKTLTIDTGMQPLDLSGKMKNRTLTLEVLCKARHDHHSSRRAT